MGKKIDLDRVRRAEERIEAILRDHPEIAERTAHFLSSGPSQKEMEDLTMARPNVESSMGKRPLQLRLPEDILKRLDALTALLQKDPNFRAMGTVTRSTALRLALIRGLEVLEQERGPKERG